MNVVSCVKVSNFRSHETFSLNCWKSTTLIIGENGSGKTSLLEAIYMILRGKSFRSGDVDILRRGAEFYRVEVQFFDSTVISVVYDGERRRFRVQDKEFLRLPKKSQYPVVFFEPDDLHLIHSSPSRRREFFDRLISQVDEGYHGALAKYNRALKQRNGLFREGVATSENVFSWDVMLAKYGNEILRGRSEYVSRINERLTEVYRSIADNCDEVMIKTAEVIDEGAILRRLQNAFEYDKVVGHTGFGPHRDDFSFLFNGSLASERASRGEIRSMVLALKFIEAGLVQEYLGKVPVVLLDDIFSELDEARQRRLIENFKEHQVIITGVGLPREMREDVNLG